jgi:hypothetical protein
MSSPEISEYTSSIWGGFQRLGERTDEFGIKNA